MDKTIRIQRYFDSFIKLKKAEIKRLKAKKFRMMVENEPKCNILSYPYFKIKWFIQSKTSLKRPEDKPLGT